MFDGLFVFLDQVLPWLGVFIVLVGIITIWLVLKEDEYEDDEFHPNFYNKHK